MEQHNSVKFVKAAKMGYIAMSVICCILGIVLIVFPEISAAVIGKLMGVMMLVFGIVKLAGYFSRDFYRFAFQYDLSFGILLIALGILALLRTDNAMNFICIVLGVFVLTDGLFKIQLAVDSKKYGVRPWRLMLIFAVLTGIVGIILIFRPTESVPVLIMLLGISLLAEGILSLSTVLTAVRILRQQTPDIIEADYYEEKD